MDIIKHLNLWDIVGPIIATLATILALFGDTFEQEKNKLRFKGTLILVLAVLGFFVTIGGTYNSNKENSENVDMISNNLNEIKIQNSNLIKNDSLDKFLNDSLNKVIQSLSFQLIDISNQELEKERRAKAEYIKILNDNFKLDIKTNIELIESWNDLDLNNFKNIDGFLTGKFQYDFVIEGLKLPVSFEVKKMMKAAIENMRMVNELIEFTRPMGPGEGKIKNINSIVRYNDSLLKQLTWINKRI